MIPEGHLLKGERGCDFVDRAVSAPCDHEARPADERRLRELSRVSSALGDEHVGRLAVRVDHGGSQFDARARLVEPEAARDRIDDDGDGH